MHLSTQSPRLPQRSPPPRLGPRGAPVAGAARATDTTRTSDATARAAPRACSVNVKSSSSGSLSSFRSSGARRGGAGPRTFLRCCRPSPPSPPAASAGARGPRRRGPGLLVAFPGALAGSSRSTRALRRRPAAPRSRPREHVLELGHADACRHGALDGRVPREVRAEAYGAPGRLGRDGLGGDRLHGGRRQDLQATIHVDVSGFQPNFEPRARERDLSTPSGGRAGLRCGLRRPGLPERRRRRALGVGRLPAGADTLLWRGDGVRTGRTNAGCRFVSLRISSVGCCCESDGPRWPLPYAIGTAHNYLAYRHTSTQITPAGQIH